MYAQTVHLLLVLATYYHSAASLQATCNTTFSDLKHSITKVICPANCLTHSHELCGNGVYSRGPICLAAIQDQQIDNSGGLVTVYKANGKLKYLGDQRNGAFSKSCGPSDVSYAFRMTCSTDGNSETEVTHVVCPPKCSKSHVYPCGTEFYHQNSSVCGAALKRNLIQESISECDLGHRCENNSTCIDGIMEYFCACTNGYYGKYCQEKVPTWFNTSFRSYVAADGVATLCDSGWTTTKYVVCTYTSGICSDLATHTNNARAAYENARRLSRTNTKVFQIRDEPSVNFNRTWGEYKRGFGNFSTSFWWGLQNLYLNTRNGNCSLRIDLWDFNSNHKFASYGSFSVGSESTKYRLKIAEYQDHSTAVNAMAKQKENDWFAYNNGMNFTTYDSDNDLNPNGNCAWQRGGGWWFNRCGRSGLNGPVERNPLGSGHVHEHAYIRWQSIPETFFPWRKSMMKFRCK